MTDSNTMLAAFTELAPHYEDAMAHELTALWGLDYREFVSGLLDAASVEDRDTILDVATGTALVPRILRDTADYRGQVVGLDITPAMLLQAQNRIAGSGRPSSIQFICASAMNLPFDDGTFDVVICGFGTHHMNVPQMLSEMRRVLKARGRLLLADAAVPALWQTLGWKPVISALLPFFGRFLPDARTRSEADAIRNMRTVREWQAELSTAGFVEITVTEHRARRPWYPSALTMKAVIAGTQALHPGVGSGVSRPGGP